MPLQAHALALALPGDAGFPSWFDVGDRVERRGELLQIGHLTLAGPATIADPAAYRPQRLIRSPDSVLRLTLLTDCLQQFARQRPVSELNCMHPWVRPLLDDCVQALFACEPCQAPCRRIVGLGAGLTPAGDDFLCGLLAVLYAMHHPLFAELSAAILPLIGQTTRVSQDYLLLAGDGIFSPLTCRLLQVLAEEDGRAIECSATDLLAHGSSSGMDTLAGCLAGLSALGWASIAAK
ncbi:DUF2877 domain-containing protein [Craterilacuibacter sp. RT1T]|nr:DUF2877 domain-containing protein [Craterilacuibacter sp. RT1T]